MIKGKKFFIGLALASLGVACSSDDDFDRGNWVESSVFDGVPRSSAAAFTIDNLGYMGTGYDGDDYLSDFWEYNIEGDYWVQKADFPSTPRSAASAFTIDGKGYLGLGYDGDDELQDFWEYNPATNTWDSIADFGGGVRRSATGFAINGTGYVGTGYDGDNDLKDFWKYNPSTDQWTEMVGFGGGKRRDAAYFILNDLVYFGTGVTNGVYNTDFWQFDPSSEVWTRLNDLDEEDSYSVVRSNAVGFSQAGYGYFATGYNGGALDTIWEYDPTNDDWEKITEFEATARQDAVSFSTATRAFVLLGRTGSLYLDDNYEVFTQDEYDEED
ncbi:Galactose oxidase, central domain [Mesonia phycicola]|uniref:Galactose oxidase, central domain n=1 Tax=Mesonia phycicola TaxID=579105 RepID=A0A1M6C081_9FLAO|nr:kelch repeat-containing protein [Mesonia phycicola]SHI54435.1 Galactose oxidase, central domain [Mesonia phycicola]